MQKRTQRYLSKWIDMQDFYDAQGQGLAAFKYLVAVWNNGLCCGDEEPSIKGSFNGHTHNELGDSEYGNICLKAGSPIFEEDGKPSVVFLHEYAHLMAVEQNHSVEWRQFYAQLLWTYGYLIPRYLGRFN